ncbi:MAG: sensor histidine kinase [bacterium]|nr:sensor histidine kinase [bacterium]
MRIEVVQAPLLDDRQRALLSMHSLLNILTVLKGELQLLRLSSGDEHAFAGSLGRIEMIRQSLQDTEKTMYEIGRIDDTSDLLVDEISHFLDSLPEEADEAAINLSLDNVRSTFSVLKIRSAEIVERSDDPYAWVKTDITRLKADFARVLLAMEKNSRGGYGIALNTSTSQPDDYRISFEIVSPGDSEIFMPLVLRDVMRDLLANARKYSPPGSMISARLENDGECLRFEVKDNGRGIPPGDMERVVAFGERGNNVDDKPAMGGGFGLTKAAYVTKRLGGRFWIDSTLDKGTTVQLEIPRRVL